MIGGEQLSPFLLALPVALAFSNRVRDQIIGRAGNKSEVSGQPPKEDETLHASHINHDKSKPDYNTPENGQAMLPHEHAIYHRVHRGRAEEIGLSEAENESAIALLVSLLTRKK